MKKFEFTTCFEEELEKERAAREKASAAARVPTFSQQQLEEARRQSHQQGLEQGRKEIQESLDAQATKILEGMNTQLARMQKEHEQEILTVRERCLQSVRLLIERVVPVLVEKSGFAEIEDTLGKALEAAIYRPKVIILVAEENVPKVKEKIGSLPVLQTETCEIDVRAHEALGPADFKLSWGKEGGAEHDTTDLALRLMQILNAHWPKLPAATPTENQKDEGELEIEILPPDDQTSS